MPRIQSAKKALRQSEKRRKDNLRKMKSLKGSIKNIQKMTDEGKTDEAKTSLSVAYKALDKAAKTNLIKKNKANRMKSRLAQRITRSSKASS
jgi:small subunit ribosomal protein S20